MNILGLDYGTAHIGVAIATGPLAEPLTTLKSDLSLLNDLLTKNSISEIVIGDCPQTFLNHLKEFGFPVHQVDETLSSHDAREALGHTTQTKRRTKEHSAAAALILQSWLDKVN